MPCSDEETKKDELTEMKQEGAFAKLLKSRTILLSGQVEQELAEKIMMQLLIMDAENHEPVKMIITSPGGHVDSGFAILDVMRFIHSPVITIGAGWVASIAVPIFFGGVKGQRFSLPNTRYLLHQPSGGAGGQAADIRIEAQEILKIRERVNKLISDETGQDIEKVARDSDRNFWMNAEEAVTYGVVDKIITSLDDIK